MEIKATFKQKFIKLVFELLWTIWLKTTNCWIESLLRSLYLRRQRTFWHKYFGCFLICVLPADHCPWEMEPLCRC